MPDTVVRDGWAIGVAVYLNPFPPGSVGALHSEACVVVTGRTAQAVEAAFWLFDGISQCGRDELLAMIAKRKEADRA